MKIVVAIVCVLACLVAFSVAAHAAPVIIATQVVSGCDNRSPALTIALDNTTWNFFGGTLYYHLDHLLAGIQPSSPSNPLILQIPASMPPGTAHTLWISDSPSSTGGSTSVDYPYTVSVCNSGMTWTSLGNNPVTGTISVGCGGACDPRHGDTPCTTPLPMLCILKTGTGFPLPVPAGVNNNQYNKWSGGIVGTTAPVLPPNTLSSANAACVAAFGPGWRVAEFHDGWGWAFQAYGGVTFGSRFWVHINDQAQGRCW